MNISILLVSVFSFFFIPSFVSSLVQYFRRLPKSNVKKP